MLGERREEAWTSRAKEQKRGKEREQKKANRPSERGEGTGAIIMILNQSKLHKKEVGRRAKQGDAAAWGGEGGKVNHKPLRGCADTRSCVCETRVLRRRARKKCEQAVFTF